jgi:hypothetical protein
VLVGVFDVGVEVIGGLPAEGEVAVPVAVMLGVGVSVNVD